MKIHSPHTVTKEEHAEAMGDPLAPCCNKTCDDFLCTRDPGHEGRHVATDPDGRVWRVWE